MPKVKVLVQDKEDKTPLVKIILADMDVTVFPCNTDKDKIKAFNGMLSLLSSYIYNLTDEALMANENKHLYEIPKDKRKQLILNAVTTLMSMLPIDDMINIEDSLSTINNTKLN